MAKIKEANNQTLQDLAARHLYEMAADVIMCQLLLLDATRSMDLFQKSAKVYVNYAAAEVAKHAAFVDNLDAADIDSYRQTENSAEEA